MLEILLFCGKNKSTNQIFFSCPLARYIWNIVSATMGMNSHFVSADQCFNVLFGQKKRNIMSVGVAGLQQCGEVSGKQGTRLAFRTTGQLNK
jgi:hypothetical protein